MAMLDTARGRIYFQDTCREDEGRLHGTVLFFNGWALSSRYWSGIVRRLRPRYRVITFDQSGTGRSVLSTPPPPFTVPGFADEADALLAHLGPFDRGGIHVVGHSMGGMVAVEFCDRHPGLIQSLAIVNCGIFDDFLLEAFQYVVVGSMITLFVPLRGIFRFEPFTSLLVDRVIAKPLPDRWKKVIAEDFISTDPAAASAVGKFAIDPDCVTSYSRKAVTLDIPLLCVVGMADRTIPPEGMLALHQRRNSSPTPYPTTLCRMEAVGHLPMLESEEMFFNALLMHFAASSAGYGSGT
ncbi:alpha/beta fold hydrolase [Prosthecochloris sp. CIB 2401]|uniref:alpha/beta fold hydrolase n=1 Tax=Prosthecochloris sp. CIB 2401 TaxID=1868325 RepID=UPI00080AADD1|nr:alpha/beta hydrolase [Prosthecochloris sp. CIB 2401]ANT64029.1 Arylesterase [Prosthecochloris sp. CIB 2401]